MRFLITGGAGSVGKDIVVSLLQQGHYIRIIDKDIGKIQHLTHDNLEKLEASICDRKIIQEALKDIDVVIHLAWSFAEDPIVLLEEDLVGHAILLEESINASVSHFFYASTAVVYGKVVASPIAEDSPCLVVDARKPFYAIAKQTAENLTLAYWKTKQLPVTIFRFWWAYSEDIGGRHLRNMIKKAVSGQPLEVPEDSGGSFLHVLDLVNAILKAIDNKQSSSGEVFNLSTVFVKWDELAGYIKEVTDSDVAVEKIPFQQWKGADFFKDKWQLSTAKAERAFGYKSLFTEEKAKQLLKEAIRVCYRQMQQKGDI